MANIQNIWGVESYNNETNENGKILCTITTFADGGRSSYESLFEVEMVENHESENFWDVRATCTQSNARKYRKGDFVDFEIYKDQDVCDMASYVRDAFNNF